MNSFQDSSNLYISCNRLPGDPVSPDCRQGARKYRQYLSTTSTSTTTLASTSSLTTVPDNDDSSTSRQTQTDSHNTSSSSHQYQHTSPDLNTDNKNILIAQSESQPLLYFLFRKIQIYVFNLLDGAESRDSISIINIQIYSIFNWYQYPRRCNNLMKDINLIIFLQFVLSTDNCHPCSTLCL